MCIYLCIVHGLFPENSVVCLRKSPRLFLFSWLFAVNFCLGVFLSYPSFLMCTTCCSSLFRNTSSVPNALQQNESCDPWRILESRNVPKNWNGSSPYHFLTIYGSWCKAPWVDNPLDDPCVHEVSHIFFQKQAYILEFNKRSVFESALLWRIWVVPL